MKTGAQLQAINPENLQIPNISQAILVRSDKLLFLSGHVPLQSDGSIAGPGLAEQLEQTFVNLKTTLYAAGTDFSHVARITIYVRDLEQADLPTIRAIRDRHINHARPPASALIGVAALFDPAVRVEIDAVAAVP